MRIVIKVGTNLLTTKKGTLNADRIRRLAGEIAGLRKKKADIVLVSSGAIGAGMGKMGLKTRPDSLPEKQALAAIGQPLLMDAYAENFKPEKLPVAQVLLTRQDFDNRVRYINARNTLFALLDMGVIPVINENDTVAVDEIKFGENDTLSAMVAAALGADWLFVFTDVDGLYQGTPGKSPLVNVVARVTPEIEAYASGVSGSGKGVGGMRTKLSAAKIAASAGVTMVILNGARPGLMARAVEGETIGTKFLPRRHLEARKCWIAFGARARGRIIIDDGAAAALLKKGRSLLPSGVLSVEGSFNVGDTVTLVNPAQQEIGRGMTNYAATDIEKIKGRKTSDIRKILGDAFDEVIHCDNLVVF